MSLLCDGTGASRTLVALVAAVAIRSSGLSAPVAVCFIRDRHTHGPCCRSMSLLEGTPLRLNFSCYFFHRISHMTTACCGSMWKCAQHRRAHRRVVKPLCLIAAYMVEAVHTCCFLFLCGTDVSHRAHPVLRACHRSANFLRHCCVY